MELLHSDLALFGLAGLGLVITALAILRDCVREAGVSVRRGARE